MDLITKDSETTLVLFSSLDRVLENVEYVVMNYRPVLNGEHYLTGDEVCRRLCISKRLQGQHGQCQGAKKHEFLHLRTPSVKGNKGRVSASPICRG